MQEFIIFITVFVSIGFSIFWFVCLPIITELKKPEKIIIQKAFDTNKYFVFPKGFAPPILCDTLEDAKREVGKLIYSEENKSIHNLAYDEKECVMLYLKSLKKIYDERV